MDTSVASLFSDGALLTRDKKDEMISLKANWQHPLQMLDYEFGPTAKLRFTAG